MAQGESPCTTDSSADRPSASQLKLGETAMDLMEMDSEAAKETSELHQLFFLNTKEIRITSWEKEIGNPEPTVY